MLNWIIAVLISLSATDKPPVLTPKEIFTKNRDAVVQIFVNSELSGCGFIISTNGLVVTANHVITTKESNFTEPFSTIEVRKVGQKLRFATVIRHSNVSDTALLRIIADDLPHVTIGDARSVEPSDAGTMITFLPDSRAGLPLLVTGSVSGIGAIGQTNAVILQMPIRKGFSGSPIFSSDGRVIGIVTTRLVGISQDLDVARKQLSAQELQGSIIVSNIDFVKTMRGLIDSLDVDLVSGLGQAVDITYAKQMIAEAEKDKKQ